MFVQNTSRTCCPVTDRLLYKLWCSLRVCLQVSCTFGGHADPVEVSGELLGYVRLAPSRKTHHHDDRGGVGEVWGARCCRERWRRYVMKVVPVYKTVTRSELTSWTCCALQPESEPSCSQRAAACLNWPTSVHWTGLPEPRWAPNIL